MLEENARIVVTGKKDDRRGDLQIIAKSFERIENLREKFQHKIALELDIDTHILSDEDLQKMAGLFKQNQGETNVQFNVLSAQAKRPFAMHVRKFVIEPNEKLMSGLEMLLGKDAVNLTKTN